MQVMGNLRSTENPKTLGLTQLLLKTPVSALSCFLSQAGQEHRLKSLSPAYPWDGRRDSGPTVWWELAHRPQEKDRVWILPAKPEINNFITPKRQWAIQLSTLFSVLYGVGAPRRNGCLLCSPFCIQDACKPCRLLRSTGTTFASGNRFVFNSLRQSTSHLDFSECVALSSDCTNPVVFWLRFRNCVNRYISVYHLILREMI